MATIDEIRRGMEPMALQRRLMFVVIINPDPERVAGRSTIPDWYIAEMSHVNRQADSVRDGLRQEGHGSVGSALGSLEAD